MSNLTIKLKTMVSNCVVRVCNSFPIKNNKVFIYSYYGSQYGCSPKYISEYLVENYAKDKFDIVWAFNDIESNKNITGIRSVKTMSLRYFYDLCTAKVIITNFRTTDLFKKRKNQYYIQTWHSSLRLKQIEKDAEDSLPKVYIEQAKKDSPKCDLLLSGCRFSTDIFKRAFWYSGEIFEHGTPRNDVLLKNNIQYRDRVKEQLKIEKNKKVVLYAPTFRKGNNLDVYNINYTNVLEALNKKFGGEWVFLVKLHPHLIAKSKELVHGDNVLDVTSYGDIQDLLTISNFLISDYSSLMFDFALTKRPCYLYVPDLNEYVSNDRKLYFNIKELPFIDCYSNNDLVKKILSFNDNNYKKELKNFSNKIGSFEDGNASYNVAKRIEKICFN